MSSAKQRLCLEQGENTELILGHMQIWRAKEPWLYNAFLFNANTYYFLCSLVGAAVVWSLFTFSAITNVAALVVGYFLSQLMFQFGHMTTHAHYIEDTFSVWEPGILIAYLHHYSDPAEIYKNWLIHRLNFLMQTRGSSVAFLFAWIVPVALFGTLLAPLYCWYLFWFALIEPAHEWYHVPVADRRRRFSLPTFYFFRVLESCGILNTRHHIGHHKHHEARKEEVTKFSDLYFPLADQAFDILWGLAIKAKDQHLFGVRTIRKTIYLQGLILVPLLFSFFSYIFCLVARAY